MPRELTTPLHEAATRDDAEAAALLLAAGADVSATVREGFTPLHFAALSYSLNAARVLLESGAAVDAVNIHGNTPLWTAAFESKGRGEMIRLLRKHGADPYHLNKAGRSALDLARLIANYEVAQFFDDLP